MLQKLKQKLVPVGLVMLGAVIGAGYLFAYGEYQKLMADYNHVMERLEQRQYFKDNGDLVKVKQLVQAGPYVAPEVNLAGEYTAKNEGNVLNARFPLAKGIFTAYNSTVSQCGKDDGITASGARAQINYTLACPPEYSFGTKILVEGIGERVCEDRGGAIKNNHFDLYFGDYTKVEEAFDFGKKHLGFKIID